MIKLHNVCRAREIDKKTQGAEQQLNDKQRGVDGNLTGGTRGKESDDFMERQAAVAAQNNDELGDFIKNFDPKTASKEEIRQMQRIIAPADAELSDPDDAPSYKYFDDADWGKRSMKAFADYMNTWGY